jgi:hypothetical protein
MTLRGRRTGKGITLEMAGFTDGWGGERKKREGRPAPGSAGGGRAWALGRLRRRCTADGSTPVDCFGKEAGRRAHARNADGYVKRENGGARPVAFGCGGGRRAMRPRLGRSLGEAEEGGEAIGFGSGVAAAEIRMHAGE